MPERVQAVVEVPSPKNVSQLRAFLGMVNYYHRFLPNLSQQLAPYIVYYGQMLSGLGTKSIA